MHGTLRIRIVQQQFHGFDDRHIDAQRFMVAQLLV
jgi:hypothetical protein